MSGLSIFDYCIQLEYERHSAAFINLMPDLQGWDSSSHGGSALPKPACRMQCGRGKQGLAYSHEQLPQFCRGKEAIFDYHVIARWTHLNHTMSDKCQNMIIVAGSRRALKTGIRLIFRPLCLKCAMQALIAMGGHTLYSLSMFQTYTVEVSTQH